MKTQNAKTDSRLWWRDKRVMVTGGNGFLGRMLCARLNVAGVRHLSVVRRMEYNLLAEGAAAQAVSDYRPQVVFHLAAVVGGIQFNTANPASLLADNVRIGMNLLAPCQFHGVEKFINVGTTCSYPKHCPIPFREDDLWNGYPDETNAPYGIAKKCVAELVRVMHMEFGFPGVTAILANLYGPGDNFDLQTSHVMPGMIRRIATAKANDSPSVTLWGTGTATRDFLHVCDAADALIEIAEHVEPHEVVNIGTGVETRIDDLAGEIVGLCEYQGVVEFDSTRPDGQPRRCLSSEKRRNLIKWEPQISLHDGLSETITWWKQNSRE